MTFRDWVRSLVGLPPLDRAAPTQTIDDGGNYYLGTPRPGALVQEAGATFPNPFGMPIGFLFDLATPPDYDAVLNGGNRRSILDILQEIFPGITPSGNSGNPVLDFLNGFTPPIPGTVLTPAQIFARDLQLRIKNGTLPPDILNPYRPDLYPEPIAPVDTSTPPPPIAPVMPDVIPTISPGGGNVGTNFRTFQV